MRKCAFYVLSLSDALVIWDQGTYGLNDMGNAVPLIALGFLPCQVSVKAALRWCMEMTFVT